MKFQSYAERVRELAAADPDRTAVVAVPVDGPDVEVTWRDLLDRSTRLARLLTVRGVRHRDTVVVALPNGIEHVVASVAAWQIGACVLPLSPTAPAPERDRHLALAKPVVVVADWPDVAGALLPADVALAGIYDSAPLPDVVAEPGKVIGTGGSTGHPKLMRQPGPWGYDPKMIEQISAFGLRPDLVNLVPGPLHHSFGFDWCYLGLLLRHTVVLLERFDAERAVAAIERHKVEYVGLVPTMMRRIAQLPGIDERDLSSIGAILHSAAPCPPRVKERWIELIGPEKVIEGYGASEGFGNTIIRGDEWLEHRGSVGRPYASELRILDDKGREVAPGDVGEVFMRRPGNPPDYVGSVPPKMTADGFGSVGDLGWLDADGYLYLADRRVDLVITGGVNVYPAEVEAALTEHDAVADVVIIGLPDEEWGKRVHAIVQLRPSVAEPSYDELTAHCRARLAAYKAPKSYEFVPSLPRDDGGKLRRSSLVAERTP